MEEIWKDIEGYEGLYQVSNLGRVKSLERTVVRKNGVLQKNAERILKPQPLFSYLGVYLYDKNSNRKSKMIHRLVAETFIPNPEGKKEVNHVDGDKFNNTLNNLEWVTPSENIRHAIDTKLLQHYTKYSKEEILNCYKYIIETGTPIKTACKKFNIKYGNFMTILNGKTRRDLGIPIVQRQNYNRKLSTEDVQQIRLMLSSKKDMKLIAEKYDVNVSCINKIRRGELYKNY